MLDTHYGGFNWGHLKVVFGFLRIIFMGHFLENHKGYNRGLVNEYFWGSPRSTIVNF